MGDRELLELAAKAADMPLCHYWSEMNTFVIASGPNTGAWWNPLTDDGDALRLAVKLDIQHFRRGTYICAQGYWRDDIISDVAKVAEDIRGDACAATRRAIVRAAAEISRNTAQGDGGGV